MFDNKKKINFYTTNKAGRKPLINQWNEKAQIFQERKRCISENNPTANERG